MIQFFDKFMNRLEDLDFIEVAWNRKWIEPGDFSIHLAAADWNQNVKFVKNSGRPETGIVQKIVYEVTPQGALVTISGFFAEKKLSGFVNLKNINIDADRHVYDTIANYFNEFAWGYEPSDAWFEPSEIPPMMGGIECTPSDDWMDKISYSFEEGKDAATAMYELCALYDRSFNVSLEKAKENAMSERILAWHRKIEEPHYTYCITPKKGVDLRGSVFFGTGWQNVSKIEYVYDDSGAFSTIEARQTMDEEGFKNGKLITDESGNKKEIIKEFYCDESNRPRNLDLFPIKIIQGNVTGIELKPVNEYTIREQLKNQCKLEILNHWREEVINVDVLQNTFHYLKDYNLGDICSIVLDDLEKMFSARIMEVKEVHRKNTVEVQLVMGTPHKQKYIALNI